MADQENPVYLLSIDLGTSSCKASVVSLEGEIKSLSRTDTPKGGNDLNEWVVIPEKWWEASVSVIREAISEASVPPSSIVGVGLCAFMHTPIGLDRHGRVVTPTMIWYDTHSTYQAEILRREYGNLFREITGDEPRHNHTATKIHWLVDNFPEKVARVENWLLPKDYLRFRLTGTIGTDVSDAIGTLLYDPIHKCWNEMLVRAAGTNIASLPHIDETLKSISYLSKAGSEATGLIKGTPVVGCADGYATLIGANGCSNNQTCLYLGTSAWITRFVQDPSIDPRRKIVPSTDGYHQWLGAISSAGASLNWVAKILGVENIPKLLSKVDAVPPGSKGLFFLPHLLGERGPIHNPNAKGAFMGLCLDHDRPELIRAVLEGVAFQIAAVFHASKYQDEIDSLTVVGGGASSKTWVQIISDVLNRFIEVSENVEASLLGVAALTGSALGLLSNPHINASGMFRRSYIQKPDQNRTKLYSELFKRFTEIDDMFNVD